VKLLIDECLHTSLVELAHGAGDVADHVNYMSLGGSKDWQLNFLAMSPLMKYGKVCCRLRVILE
jgi:hypothetical protein